MSDIQNEINELMETVRFGIDVESFMEGKIGRYLEKRIYAEIEEAQAALGEVAPTDVLEITRLQNDIKRAKSVSHWLAEAIQAGYNAELQIKQAEEEL